MGQLEANMGKRAVQLRKLLSDLGPSFIKIGQALSSRPDLLPQVYLEVCCPPLHARQTVLGLDVTQKLFCSASVPAAYLSLALS